MILARIAGVSTPVIIIRHIFPQRGQHPDGADQPPGGPGDPAGSLASASWAWDWRRDRRRGASGCQRDATSSWTCGGVSLFPGLAITVVVMAFNFFGDWLRDYLDPKPRRA